MIRLWSRNVMEWVLTQLAGAAVPAEYRIDGRPLDKLLNGQVDTTHPATFLMHYPHAPHRSNYFTVYRDGDWKVIYHYYPSEASENSPYQLYNLKTDPFESTNLASQHPSELQRMMRQLAAALEDAQAQYPLNPEGTAELRPQMP